MHECISGRSVDFLDVRFYIGRASVLGFAAVCLDKNMRSS